MRRSSQSFFVGVLLSVLLTALWVPVSARDGFMADDISSFENIVDYETYFKGHLEEGAVRPDYDVYVFGENYVSTNMDVELVYVEENNGFAVRTGDWGYIAWEVEIPEAGFYNMELHYLPVEGRGISIERSLEINGEIPFEGANYLVFPRVWGDAEEIRMDNQGNELRPLQKEFPIWQTKVLDDSMGDYLEPYSFYFEEGRNTIVLYSRREPMLVDYLRIFQVDELPTYAEKEAEYKEKGYTEARDVFIKLQERDSTYRSESTISPMFDQGDPTMEPYHPALIRLNMIGGDSWSQTGQWVRWDFEVPADGLYKIAIKGKQNLQRGSFSNRRVYIDGHVPFSELQAVRFPYSASYMMNVLGPRVGRRRICSI